MMKTVKSYFLPIIILCNFSSIKLNFHPSNKFLMQLEPQFASSVLSVWLTHVIKKKKTTFGASQSPMTQNKKENACNPNYPK